MVLVDFLLFAVCEIFKRWIDDNNLCDLGYSGAKFTWCRGTVAKRLDRVLCNAQWFDYFVNAYVKVLPKIKSDHSPLLIHFDRDSNQHGRDRPFRFLASGVLDDRFKNFVKDNWNGDVPYGIALTNFVEKASHWNI